MDEKHSDPSTMTMNEIDLFENRLQLKTLQEGLKHKVASTDITPDLVHDAVKGGIGDYTAKFAAAPQRSVESRQSGAGSLRNESSLSGSLSNAESQDFDEKLPVIYPPPTPPPVVPQAVLSARILHLDILHASALEALPCYWKTGVESMLCHPYCIVNYGNQMVRGKTIKNSRNPIMKQAIKLHAPREGPTGTMTISVYTEEPSVTAATSQADTLIGSATFDVDQALVVPSGASAVIEAGPTHKWLDLKGGVSGSLHISISIQDIPA